MVSRKPDTVFDENKVLNLLSVIINGDFPTFSKHGPGTNDLGIIRISVDTKQNRG